MVGRQIADTATSAIGSTGTRDGLPQAPLGYELLRMIDGGGMGVVYVARDQVTDRVVAMKFLRGIAVGSAVDRFLVEVRALAALDHPNIVRVLGHDFHRSDPYFTMEYQPGGTLAERVRSRGPLPPAEAAALIRTVAGAVAAAHAENILHRDLKPSNILLTADGTPKVSDFGLAKRTDKDDGLTADTGALGTPGYMPPEQISKRHGEVGPASDVYGLGATLYHLLTGQAPFRGAPAEVMNRVLTELPQRPRAVQPEIPLALEAVVMKCLEKNPADRYPTPAALAADLDKYLAGLHPDAPLLTPIRRARQWVYRRRGHLAVAMLLVAIGVGLVAAGTRMAPVPPQADTKPEVEPIEAIRGELATDRRSVLLGASGRPRHARWLIGTATILEPTDTNPEFAFEAPEPTQLELLANPGAEQYRITGEFQLRYHKTIVNMGKRTVAALSPDTTLFGVYCGDVPLATGDGRPVRVSLVAAYKDFLSKEVREQLPKLRGFAQLEAAAIVPTSDGALASRTAGAGGVYQFDPTDTLPTPWRRVRIDVSPAGVEMFWAASPTARWQLVCKRTAAELANDLNRKVDTLDVNLAAHPPLTWNPAASCGIWCRGAAIAVKNVTVETPPYLPE